MKTSKFLLALGALVAAFVLTPAVASADGGHGRHRGHGKMYRFHKKHRPVVVVHRAAPVVVYEPRPVVVVQPAPVVVRETPVYVAPPPPPAVSLTVDRSGASLDVNVPIHLGR